MLTREQVLSAVKAGRKSDCLDGRDYTRLAQFFSAQDLPTFELTLKEGATWEAEDFTEENVRKRLAEDVAFGFDKALNQRGISASLMHAVVMMWMWVLDDDLQHCSDYAQYGLPLLKKVAVKYGLPNPIGDDYGDEGKYGS